MCRCEAYLELSGQSYISRANFALFFFLFFFFPACCNCPLLFCFFCFSVLAFHLLPRRGLWLAGHKPEMLVPGRGPAVNSSARTWSDRCSHPVKTGYKLQPTACGAFKKFIPFVSFPSIFFLLFLACHYLLFLLLEILPFLHPPPFSLCKAPESCNHRILLVVMKCNA